MNDVGQHANSSEMDSLREFDLISIEAFFGGIAWIFFFDEFRWLEARKLSILGNNW